MRFSDIDAMERRSDVPGLCAALTADVPPKLREDAIWALKRLRDPDAAPALVASGLQEKNNSVRLALVETLRALRDQRAAPYFIQALSDEKQNTRLRAIWGLVELGSRDGVRPLVQLLDDPDPAVRVGAARGLARLGDDAALAPIEAAIQTTRSPLARMRLKQARSRLLH